MREAKDGIARRTAVAKQEEEEAEGRRLADLAKKQQTELAIEGGNSNPDATESCVVQERKTWVSLEIPGLEFSQVARVLGGRY